MRLIVRRFERGFDGFHHLGAARTIARTKKRLGLSQVLASRRHWFGKQDTGVARKSDEVERVSRIETVERELHRLLRLLDRESAHRARRVEHKHELLWRHVCNRDAVGWLQNHREETASFGAMRQHCILDGLRRDVVTKNEIFVGNR